MESTLTCPSCGHRSVETMPSARKGCGTRHNPLAGDCRVFCSYGSVPCPPVQSNDSCCARKDSQALRLPRPLTLIIRRGFFQSLDSSTDLAANQCRTDQELHG
jgi:hypothetical protein